jgi:preprotein translocase subunit SecB
VKSPKTARSGYSLERVYVTQQQYEVLDPEDVESVPGERGVAFGWDWRAVGKRRFEVLVELSVEPTPDAAERAHVRLFGVFSATETLSIKFNDFVRHNGPALLFPYAREVVSTMTGRGPFGAFHVDPLNMRDLQGLGGLEDTQGYIYLTQHPDEAEDFELLEFEEHEAET